MYIKAILETFTDDQELKKTNNDYYESFSSQTEMVKAHSGKPWILDSLRNRILGEVMAEDSCTNILALMDNQA